MFSVNNGGDNTWSGRVTTSWLHSIPSHGSSYAQAGWHLYSWQPYFPQPPFNPSPQSLYRLRICQEEAGEEKVHLNSEQERPLLELWEGSLQDQQDGNDADYAEGEDDVEVGEGDEVGDRPPGPSAQCTLDGGGPERCGK